MWTNLKENEYHCVTCGSIEEEPARTTNNQTSCNYCGEVGSLFTLPQLFDMANAYLRIRAERNNPLYEEPVE